MIRYCTALGILVAGSIPALGSGPNPAGGGGGGGGITAPGAAEIRTLSEKVPAGGTVQVKHLFTQPRPITSSGAFSSLNGFSVDGVAISSPLGDAAGTAVAQNGLLYVNVVSPASDFGMSLDYPFLIVTMDIPGSTAAGSVFPLGISNMIADGPGGPLTLVDPKPGTLTIGGSVSVRGVYPGGGTWPAGTVISVRGTGFQPSTRVSTKMRTSNPVYISPTEIQFALLNTTTLDMQPVQITNPDGSQVTYYSYLRGVLVRPPSRPLLLATEPIFQTQTHGVATVGPLPALAAGQFTALAVQNPTAGPVVVSFHLQRTGTTNIVQLPSGGRVMDELSALLGGAALTPGDVIDVAATSGVQILGMQGDARTGTVTPFLPAF